MLELNLKNAMVSGSTAFLNGSRFFMFFPHICTCKKILQEKDCKYIGRTEEHRPKKVYWFNCLNPKCNTTFTKMHERLL